MAVMVQNKLARFYGTHGVYRIYLGMCIDYFISTYLYRFISQIFLSLTGCLSINRSTWKASPRWLRPIIIITDVLIVLGTAISPQIARPFLESDAFESNITTIDHLERHPIQTAFFIVSALDVIVIIACMSTCVWSTMRGGCGAGLCFRHDDDNDVIQLIPDSSDGLASAATNKVKPRSRQGCLLLTSVFLLMLTYGGIFDVLLLFLLYTYLNEYLGWSVTASTLVASTCPVVSVIFGVVLAVVSHWKSPTCLTIFSLAMWFVASVFLFIGQAGVGACTVIGVIIYASVACNIYPTTISLLEESMNVIAPVMALIVSSIGFSSIAFGPLAGTLLHKFGSVAYPSLQLAFTTIASALFIVYSALARMMTRANTTSV